MKNLQSRKDRRRWRRVRELELRADQAHGEKLDRLCDEIEETRLGIRLAESIGGYRA